MKDDMTELFAKAWIRPMVRILQAEKKRIEPCLEFTTGPHKAARALMINRLGKAIDLLNGKPTKKGEP